MTTIACTTSPPAINQRRPVRASALRCLLVVSLMLTGLTACGQKGDLVRPGKPAASHVR